MSQGLIPHLELFLQALPDIAFQADRLINGDRLLLALDLNTVDFSKDDILDRLARPVADQNADAILLGDPLKPRSQIHRIPHDSIGLAYRRSHVAYGHFARIDAHADPDFRPALRRKGLVDGRQGGLHLHGRDDSLPGMLGVGHGGAPKGHDGVPDIFIQSTAVPAHHVGHGRQVLVHQAGQLIRSETFGNRGEAAYVGKQHGEFCLAAIHAVGLRVAAHLLDQFGWHILAEQFGELALCPGFDEITVGHVEGEQGEHHQNARPERQHHVAVMPEDEVHRQDEQQHH